GEAQTGGAVQHLVHVLFAAHLFQDDSGELFVVHSVPPDSSGLSKVLAVGGDDLLVPIKAVLPAAGHGAGAVVVQIHIDHAVALFHLTGGRRHDVDGPPAGVAQQGHAVQVHRVPHGTDVLPHIVDAVGVVDRAVRFHGIGGAHAVFHDEQGLAVAVVQHVQGQPPAQGVDLPAPFAGQIG